MAGEPILVVDDNAPSAKLVRLLLEAEGYEVRTAENASEAFAILGDFEPRLVLLDMQLPGMRGAEVSRQLRADPRFGRTLILAVTAYAMKGDREQALEAGCDDYLSKPIDIAVLADRVRRLLDEGAGPR